MSSILKVGKIQSSTGNDAIEIANDGHIQNALTLDGGIANAGTISAGTIGSNVTITDGANPHGWEHIKTISYNSNVAGSQTMTNVVSSAYSAYKLIMQIGTTSTSGPELYWRFLNDSGNELAGSNKYEFGGHTMAEDNTHGGVIMGSNDLAHIGMDVYNGTRGWNGEILLTGCYASSSDFPQIDGYQLNNSGSAPASPHGSYRYTGHAVGNYDHVITGFFFYDVDPTYVTGWKLIFGSSAQIQAGSWWSCYGLKLPTAD